MIRFYKDANETYLKIGGKWFGLKFSPTYDGAGRFGLYVLAWWPKSIQERRVAYHSAWIPMQWAKASL